MFESSVQAHSYLFLAGIVVFSIFLIYVYICNHRTEIGQSDVWNQSFQKVGLSSKDIENLTHDDSMWYYRGRPTCVAYGDFRKRCPKFESYCAGGDTFGTPEQQALEVKLAIKNGGEHVSCPLIYQGAA